MLRARDIVVRYGAIVAVRGVSLEVSPGAVTALVGPNGSGKTSLLSALAGIVPASGTIELGDRPIEHLPAEQRARGGLAVVQDGRRLFGDLTVEQNLIVASAMIHGRRAASAAVATVLERFPTIAERADQRAGTLSGGEGQLLMIARALVASPTVVLADEPFEELDAEATVLVHAALSEVAASGAAVLIASPDPVPGADEIPILHGALLEAVS